MFTPIAALAAVNSPEYQENFVKPFTLFPNAGKKPENEIFPIDEDSEEWNERMQRTVAVRYRAKEIFDEMKQKRI